MSRHLDWPDCQNVRDLGRADSEAGMFPTPFADDPLGLRVPVQDLADPPHEGPAGLSGRR